MSRQRAASALLGAVALAFCFRLAVAAAAMPAADADLGPRNYTQRAANKLRPGSLIKSEGAEVRAPYIDLAGALGRRRDDELEKHYARLAEMDVIAELAVKHRDVALAERVENVRRKETERFFVVMQEIRVNAMPRAPEER
jgi:hypothetical protein